MSQVSPAEGIDLFESQKALQHPVNMQDQFFQKLYKNRKRLQVVNGVLYSFLTTRD